MGGPVRIEAGEHTADEIIDLLEAGHRVLIGVEVAGAVQDVVLRYDGETYHCDTPTSLHRHTEESEMRGCLARMGYAAED